MKVTDDHVRKTITKFVEQHDDMALIPLDVLRHMTENGYEEDQVKRVFEAMIALYQVSYYTNGRIGPAI